MNRLAASLVSQDVDVSKLSVEETKFLGGDIEHTHLVKGLDFALLQMVRGVYVHTHSFLWNRHAFFMEDNDR